MTNNKYKDFIEGPWSELWWSFSQNKGALFGLGIIIFFIFIAIFSPLIAPHDPSQIFPKSLGVPPFWAQTTASPFILGTDDVGRDQLSRLIYGARFSLGIGLLVVVFSFTVGTTLGLIAGYFGGLIDKITIGLVDMMMALPSILLAIVVVSILGPGLSNAIIAVSIVSIPSFVRLTRASVLNEKNKQYVLASQSYGANHLRVLLQNIFPNCLAPIIIQASLTFSNGILDAAALGFLGLGAQPPTAEWGTMLADARAFIESSPWMVTLPGVCILLVVLGFNLLGDGLRDALDPRLKK